jgi:peptidoglycan hydrolase CwlO-like protein
MRKSVGFVLAVIGVLLVSAIGFTYSKYKKSQADFAQATAQAEEMQTRYDHAVSEVVMIQDSLNTIVLGPNAKDLVPTSQDLEIQTPETLHDTVLSRIASLKSAIERTKVRIEELDARLAKSGTKITGLEKMIAGLRSNVAEKETHIAELSTQVDTLGVRVAGLTTQVETQQQDIEAKQAEIAQKREEIATVFYTIGTKKELTTAGVVASKGGVLGFGKTLKPSGQVNEAAFTPLDTDQENIIRIPAEKAQVLSEQPVTSYVIQPVGEKMVELRIVNPQEFRKIKHVVILKA